jgi:hypothetical protein
LEATVVVQREYSLRRGAVQLHNPVRWSRICVFPVSITARGLDVEAVVGGGRGLSDSAGGSVRRGGLDDLLYREVRTKPFPGSGC